MTAPDLAPLPRGFAATRDGLHQLAFFALAPWRYAAVGRMGLTSTPGGFGTPWVDTADGRQRARMDGVELVVEEDAGERRTRPATVREACAALGIEYRDVWFEDFHDPLAPADPDQPMELDEAAADALGSWFAFGTAALEGLGDTPGAQDVSSVQLWPEHFDPAREIGREEAGARASYGASPGDADHDQPYLFVSPWGDHDGSDYWNDPSFGGATLTHAELRATDDPLAVATAFLRRGHELLTGR